MGARVRPKRKKEKKKSSKVGVGVEERIAEWNGKTIGTKTTDESDVKSRRMREWNKTRTRALSPC